MAIGRYFRSRLGRALVATGRLIAPNESRVVVTPRFPASLDAWWDRPRKLRGSAPTTTTTLHEGHTPPLGVVMHVHFPELVPELLERLANIPVAFDLIVTNSSGFPLELAVGALPVRRLITRDVPNRGRDILPMIELVNDGVLDEYELLLKVHTKKSAWRAEHSELAGDGDTWRERLLDDLLGDREQVASILSEFADDPTLGMLTAAGSIADAEFWGGDRHIVEALLTRLQMTIDPVDLRFAAGSIYWVRAFIIQGLRALDLTADDFEVEQGQVDGTTAHGVERALGYLTVAADYDLRVPSGAPATDGWLHWETNAFRMPRARVLPFYLPQFHTFPENDEWWGRGFTEWSNVTAAKPVFDGHVQPLLPGELGFYDILAGSTRDRQYELARQHGIEGFMYYYYWFSGEPLMSQPLQDLIASGADHPFCIMWANENWTRTWDGGNKGVLKGQDYDAVPAERFIDDVMDLLTDPRYIQVGGRPLVAVYKIGQLPDPRATFAEWRKRALAAGLPGLHIVAVDVGSFMDGLDASPEEIGFDAYLEFPPHNFRWDVHDIPGLSVDPRFDGHLLHYDEFVASAVASLLTRANGNDDRYPGVMVNFDNTARRQWRPDIWYGSNPYVFRRWLNSAVGAIMHRDRDSRIVFVNAWNEWAEGAVLEPTQRFGRGYLHAVRDVLIR